MLDKQYFVVVLGHSLHGRLRRVPRVVERAGLTTGKTAMTDSDAVLAANLEFYRAFAARDLMAMDALWARHAPVGCIHPGWPALADRDAIIESWRGILSSPEAPRIVCYDERVFLYGDTALVLCEEELDGGTLVASNLDRKSVV